MGLELSASLDDAQKSAGHPAGVEDRATTTWARRSRTTSCSITPASRHRRSTRASADQLLALVPPSTWQHGRWPCEGEDGGGASKHLDDTYFAWIGGTEPTSVFYYRIHSPVLLIEFDHQTPIGIRHLMPGRQDAVREHIHTVVRTPNGNDYGKDLLRQHYSTHPH